MNSISRTKIIALAAFSTMTLLAGCADRPHNRDMNRDHHTSSGYHNRHDANDTRHERYDSRKDRRDDRMHERQRSNEPCPNNLRLHDGVCLSQ